MHPKLLTLPAFDLLGRSVGPLTLHTYGVLLAIAFITGLWVASRQAKSAGLDPARVTDMAVYVLIGGLVVCAEARAAALAHRGRARARGGHRPGHRAAGLLRRRLLLRAAGRGALGRDLPRRLRLAHGGHAAGRAPAPDGDLRGDRLPRHLLPLDRDRAAQALRRPGHPRLRPPVRDRAVLHRVLPVRRRAR